MDTHSREIKLDRTQFIGIVASGSVEQDWERTFLKILRTLLFKTFLNMHTSPNWRGSRGKSRSTRWSTRYQKAWHYAHDGCIEWMGWHHWRLWMTHNWIHLLKSKFRTTGSSDMWVGRWLAFTCSTSHMSDNFRTNALSDKWCVGHVTWTQSIRQENTITTAGVRLEFEMFLLRWRRETSR